MIWRRNLRELFKMTQLLIFGDSIVWGAFDTQEGGWVERLKKYYLKNGQKGDYSVYNLGISGEDSQGILNRIDNTLKDFNRLFPSTYSFIFSIGCNDTRFTLKDMNCNISLEKFEENLNEIIKIAKKYSNKIIFTGILNGDDSLLNPVGWSETDSYSNKNLKQYNDKIKEICKKNNLKFVPFWDLLDIKKDLKDGLHPNSKGHKKIFEQVIKFLN